MCLDVQFLNNSLCFCNCTKRHRSGMTKVSRIFETKIHQYLLFLLYLSAMSSCSDSKLSTQTEITHYATSKVDDFKLRLHQLLEELRILRRAYEKTRLLPSVSTRDLEFFSDESVTAGCVVQQFDSEMAFVVDSSNVLHLVLDVTLQQIYHFHSSRRFVNLKAFSYGNEIWLMSHLVDNSDNHFIKLFSFSHNALHSGQELSFPGPVIVSSTSLGYKTFMVVASTSDVHPMLTLYEWLGVQFGSVLSTQMETNCKSISVYHVQDEIHIALGYAMKKNVMVQKYNPSSRKARKIQFLEVDARLMKHFEDSGSYYLLCATKTAVLIYWWSGAIYLQYQKIAFHKTIVDISIHKYLQQTIIVVALQDEIRFLTQYTTFRYIKAGRVGFHWDTLQRILLWQRGNSLALMPLFRKAVPPNLYEVFMTEEPSQIEREPTLENCIKDVEELLLKRKPKIREMISISDRVWLPSRQQLIKYLNVNGSVTSPKSIAGQRLLMNTDTQSLNNVHAFYANVHNSTEYVHSQISNSLFKSRTQIIKGTVILSDEIRFKRIKLGNFKKHLNINGVRTDRLPYTLKTKGSQIFYHDVTTTDVTCHALATWFLNGNAVNDYVLLNSPLQNLTGHFTFTNIAARNLYLLQNAINGLNLHNFVLTYTAQDIYHTKFADDLTASVINTYGNVNGLDLRLLEKSVIYLDSGNFNADLTFSSVLDVGGKLRINTLNGFNLMNWLSHAVTKNKDEAINGYKHFKNTISAENVQVSGLINNVSTTNLMTLHTFQTIIGTTLFNNVTFSDIETSSLNGINIGEEAVIKTGTFTTVHGTKHFSEVLNVSTIETEEGVSLDSFEILQDSQEINECRNYYGRNVHCFLGNVTLENVIVEENLEVEIENDDIPLTGLFENVWYKLKPQNISYLHVNTLSAPELIVDEVNGIHLEDIVTVNGNESINSTKRFVHDVVIGKLLVKDGVNLDYGGKIWNPHTKFIATGDVLFENLAVKGNLILSGKMNGVAEMMSVENYQIVTGSTAFDEMKTDHLNAATLDLIYFNKSNFRNYLDNAFIASKKAAIRNKSFLSLMGSELVCAGTLNDKFLDKVVTTNTVQFISANIIFHDNLVLDNTVIANFKEFSLEDIVFVDEVQKISNKTFIGRVTTTQVNVRSLVNGQDLVSLQSNAFNKSGNNTVTEFMTFHSNIELTSLHIKENGKIDDVDLGRLVYLNKKTSLPAANFSSVHVMDISVFGHINKCNFTSVLKNGLLKKKYSQNITAHTTIDNLHVDGDIAVIGYMKGLSEVMATLNDMSYHQLEGNFIFDNVAAQSVRLTDLVNNINVGFILDDAVLNSMPQTIMTEKKFSAIHIQQASVNFLQGEMVCHVNVSHLFETSVNKRLGNITLFSTTLSDLEADNIKIEGSLNGLKLPQDVYLVDTDDVITSDVEFKNSTHANNGILITNTVNDIPFQEFIEKRVTLSSTQNISADLVFMHDSNITGNVEFCGTLNDIYLSNVVTLQNSRIEGIKNFTKKLRIWNDVTVGGMVNEISLVDLEKNMLRVSKNETLNALVKFAELGVSSLFCERINGIDVTDFYEETLKMVNISFDKQYNFTSIIQSHSEIIDNQRESVWSVFSYFELHQMLSSKTYGSIQRFLPVYEYGVVRAKYELSSNQMIMWVKTSSQCRPTKSVVADVLKDGFLSATKTINGKVFPFSLREERENVIGFYVKADYTRRCLPGSKKRITIKTLFTTGSNTTNIIQQPADSEIVDIHLLEIDEIFLIFAFNKEKESSDRIFAYIYNVEDDSWTFHHSFHSENVISFDLAMIEKKSSHSSWRLNLPDVYLAIAGENNNPGITLYEWDFDLDHFEFAANVTTSVSSDVLWVEKGDDLFLLLAKEMTKTLKENSWVNVYNEPLDVYQLDKDLTLHQTVKVKGVMFLEAFHLAGELFVLAASNHMETLYVLQFRGYNGFEVIQQIPSPGITRAYVFNTETDLFVAVASKTEHSRILKASLKGVKEKL